MYIYTYIFKNSIWKSNLQWNPVDVQQPNDLPLHESRWKTKVSNKPSKQNHQLNQHMWFHVFVKELGFSQSIVTIHILSDYGWDMMRLI